MHHAFGRGENNPNWKGGKQNDGRYFRILMPTHLRANPSGRVREHILIAEKSLGKPIPLKAVVHHINGNCYDNNPKNLIICENNIYHLILHQRERALMYGGNVRFRKCLFCKNYDSPDNLFIGEKHQIYHRRCKNIYQIKYKKLATQRISILET